MKISVSQLRQMIQEEMADLLEKSDDPSHSEQEKIAKNQNKDTAKFGAKFVDDAPEHFSSTASPEQAGDTIHNCSKEVIDQDREEDGESLSKPHTKKEQSKGYAICTKTAAVHGATGEKSRNYDKGSECARVGGKTPEGC
jgi:hypothetical protein